MNPAFEQEPDVVPAARVGVIGGASLLVAVVGVCASTAILHAQTPPSERWTSFAAPDQIGIVEQTPIQTARRGADLRREQLRELSDYRWLDPAHTIAQIPIDRAMRVIVQEKR